MGYTTKDIALITEPKRVSLSALSNFVQFASKPRVRTAYQATIQINEFTPQWVAGYYYDVNGVQQTVVSATQKVSGNVDVSAYAGLAFHLLCYCTGTAYVVVFNAANAPIQDYQITGAALSAVMPAAASYIRISNDTSHVGTPTLIIDSTSHDILAGAWDVASVLNITEPSGAVHSFNGTSNPALVGGTTYFVGGDKSDTAENLRQALFADVWVVANLDIKIPFTWDETTMRNGNVLYLTSNGYGADFNIGLAAPNNTANSAYTITIINATSQNGDSISGEASTIEVSLDVYTDAPIFLGQDDAVTNTVLFGNFAVSLSKTYSGDTLWFDINAPFSKYGAFNIPPGVPGWFNTGTMRVVRFIARVAGINNFSFYQSNALYILKGYGLASDPIDLTGYTYVTDKIKLLTNKPRTIYVKGQTEYLNFIFKDQDRGIVGAPDWQVKIIYRAYDTMDNFIGQSFSDPVNRSVLNMVNTATLRIDDLLTTFPNAGIVRVALARGNAIISNDLEYTIRPSALHTLNCFSFLNRLGGWDSFNFDATASEDVKVTFATYFKTVTPAHTKSEGIETVYSSDLADTITVVGAPVTDDVAEWLKELAASTVVLDAQGNYIIKTGFTATLTDGAKNMQTPTVVYRTSETYTNE